MRLAAALLAVALAAGTGLLAREPAPLTKITVRTMPPQVLTRRLFGDLGDIMLPISYNGPAGRRPTRPLASLEFLTVPRAADIGGICETQWITVDFEPAGQLRGADTPVRPRRIASHATYFIRDLARLRADPVADGESERSADAACRAIDPRQVRIITAPTAYQVQDALRILSAFIDAARAGRVLAPLDCSGTMMGGVSPSDAHCLAAIGQLGVNDVSAIGSCESGVPGLLCHRISLGGYEMTFIVELNGRRLARAKLEAMIVFADQRID